MSMWNVTGENMLKKHIKSCVKKKDDMEMDLLNYSKSTKSLREKKTW